MNINFKMWRTAAWQLVKMEDKKKWDALDIISKWLIATRSGVTTVTIYSCIIAGLFAWRDKSFAWLPWLIVTIGLFIAHGTNNLLNDYTDFSRGSIKTTTSAPNMVSIRCAGLLDEASATALVRYKRLARNPLRDLRPFLHSLQPDGHRPVRFGALMLLFYTYPLKYFALGELAIFLIWGPIMVAGVYLVPDSALELECCPGRRSVWVVCGEHQCRQAHRQAPGGQGQRCHHATGVNR